MDGASNNAPSDPGTRTVLFPTQLFAAPNNLVFGICKHYVGGPVNYIHFEMSYSGLTDTGFVFHSNFPVGQYKDTLISYMTIYDNYGVELHRKSFGQFTYSMVDSHHSYLSQIATTSINLNHVDSTEQFIAVYTEIIQVNSFYQADLYTTNYTIDSANMVSVRAYLPQSCSPVNLALSVLVLHYPTLNTAIAGFKGYYFQGGVNIGVVDNVVEFMTATNATSTLYFLVGPTKGGLSRGYNYAFTFGSTPAPAVGGFSVSFMRSRSSSYNMIQTRFFTSSSTVSDSSFAYLHLMRTSCNSTTYPYLMLVQQQCHDAIPNSYYSNSNKQLNPCSVCTDILHCLDCMDTMCTSS